MDRYELNQLVLILDPFGDGVTPHPITAVMGINSNGKIAQDGEAVEYYQYEVDGVFYAEHFLKAV